MNTEVIRLIGFGGACIFGGMLLGAYFIGSYASNKLNDRFRNGWLFAIECLKTSVRRYDGTISFEKYIINTLCDMEREAEDEV